MFQFSLCKKLQRPMSSLRYHSKVDPPVPSMGPLIRDPYMINHFPLRVQVLNCKVSTQNHNDESQYGNPKYPIVRYFGPLGFKAWAQRSDPFEEGKGPH